MREYIGYDVGGEDFTVVGTDWQRARALDSAPEYLRGQLLWVAGRPQVCQCGHGAEHRAYLSNLQFGGVLLHVGADYVELLNEFAEHVKVERIEMKP
jgi:hypothetical protein